MSNQKVPTKAFTNKELDDIRKKFSALMKAGDYKAAYLLTKTAFGEDAMLFKMPQFEEDTKN
jgi:hypothetical protein